MDFLLDTLLHYLLLYKYAALFIITFAAALALPIPSAASLMAASAFASLGYMSIWGVAAVAVVGNVLGDNLGFWLARRFGRRVLERIGFRRILDSKEFLVIERQVENRPGLIVFFSRVEVLATLSVNLIAGLGNMRYRKFLAYEFAGEVAQVAGYASVGYAFGENWDAASEALGDFALVAFAAAALAIALFWKRVSRWISRQALKESRVGQ